MHSGIIFNVTQRSYLSRPLGGHRIASFLREQGWNIEVVDWANWWQIEDLKYFFTTRYSPDIVFVGFGHLFSIWSDVMEQFAGWIKKKYPHVKLISGSSVNPMFQSRFIDWYIQGYGEHAILELLKYIAGNGASPRFNLINDLKVIPAIDQYPAFPMKSLMVKYEDRDFIQSDEWLTIELSRGCKFACAFCNFPILGVKEDTSRDSEDFKLQLQDTYHRFGVTSYMLADETANDRIEKISKFADAVQCLDFVPWFSAYIRLDLIAANPVQNYELLRMNLLGHHYGIESMNTKSAQSIGKGMKSERIKEALLCTKDYFQHHGRQLYRGHIGLIAGLPFETEQTFCESIDWFIANWQGQSWGVHPLGLPNANSKTKQSNISKNIMSYGYTEMTTDEIERHDTTALDEMRVIQRKDSFREAESEIYWQNEHMNIFDAQRLVRDVYRTKRQHNFRPGPFMINYRMKDKKSLSERLALNFEEHDALFDYDLTQYIQKKIGANQ